MLSDYFSEINDHGTVVPVKDLAAFPRSEQATTGAYNRMEFPYYQVAPTFTKDGVTFTTDDNGIITGDSSGVAATGNAEVNIHGRLSGDTYVPMYLPIGKYKVGIGCSDSQVGIQLATTYNSGWSALTDIVYGTNWLDFEITADTHSDIKLSDGSVLVAVYIRSSNTTKVWNNIKIYPMIYPQGTPDNFFFVPYAMTNRELTKKVSPIALELTAGTNVDFNSNNKSCILGALKLIRTQIHVSEELAINSQLLSADIEHSGFGGAVLVNTNNGTVYGILASSSNNKLVLTAKTTIPAGYYALDYCYV